MPLKLEIRTSERLPISLQGVTPTSLAKLPVGEIEKQLVWQGNRQVPLAELFAVSGDASDLHWELTGDCSAVHHLGTRMTEGEIQVTGPVGRHGGSEMRGGAIIIAGNASDWLGAAMRGGSIEVTGNSGNHTGGGYPGSKTGMRGGNLLVRGSSGTHTAAAMRRGWVTVLGDCGPWAGYRMRAGSLLVFGTCGPRPGASMRRGTIALMGQSPELLPTFAYGCRVAPQALAIMLGQLAERGIQQAADAPREVRLFNGDLLEGGRGELFLAANGHR